VRSRITWALVGHAVLTVAIAAAASLVVAAVGRQTPAPPAVEGPGIGPATAPVTIVVYTDFTLASCSRLHFMLKAIANTYTDRVRIVVRQDPASNDANMWLANEAALAAAAQGRFWDMADLIFANQSTLRRDDLIAMAGHLALDVKQFTSDLDGAKFQTQIEHDRQEAVTAKLKGVPVYFLNGARQPWPTTYADLRARVDAALAGGQG
jgi:protein-disulfide isomerase